jgi:malate synthase
MAALHNTTTDDIRILGPLQKRYETILTPEALYFLHTLHKQFNPVRLQLLEKRKARQQRIDMGELPDFLADTEHIQNGNWKIDPVPPCLENRRVEITGPVDRKMIVNALNSGANVYMADFEDATSPTWTNLVDGQVNLFDAVRGELDFETADGKKYSVNEHPAVLKVRPRGWHLDEKHITINGEPLSASLFDFGLFFFHNARRLLLQEKGPFFYLPKLESHEEARLWNDVFNTSQDLLGIPRGIIKVTVLIETVLAAFEMEEILYELRTHIAGLNAGRWDYIFSIIKKMRLYSDFVLPDRARVTMDVPFMRAYAQLLVNTCHRRGAHAIGGMSAFIPSKDEKVNEKALQQVTADKQREAGMGYDGTWVAHPRLVEVAKHIFDKKLGKRPNQKGVVTSLSITANDLLNVDGERRVITEEGLRKNINVTLLYLDSWLRGIGAAALYNLMEDAATAEISRAQIWQWIRNEVTLQDGSLVTEEFYAKLRDEELQKIRQTSEPRPTLHAAAQLLDELVLDKEFEDFLTVKAYERLTTPVASTESAVGASRQSVSSYQPGVVNRQSAGANSQ